MTHVTDDRLPDTAGLAQLLREYRGGRAFVLSLTDDAGHLLGNNGDRLMQDVFWILLAELQIAVVERPEQADFLVVPPNGALHEMYNFPTILQRRLGELPDLPLVMFPSSAKFDAWNPAQIFAGRKTPTLWILRERSSYDRLRARWLPDLEAAGVSLALDHDVVVSGHSVARTLLAHAQPDRPDGTLVAAREDKEAADRSPAQPDASVTVKDDLRAVVKRTALTLALRIPNGSLRTAVFRTASVRRRAAAADRLLARAKAHGMSTEMLTSQPTCIDASSPLYATYAQYQSLVTSHAVVVTDRLHVALPAAICGARVYLVDSGYHKLSGIYSHSLTALDNLTFLSAA